MTQSVLKWGNSLALRIPAAIARQMGIEQGAELELHLEGKRLIVARADGLPEFSGDDLARALHTATRELVDFGPPRGKEVL